MREASFLYAELVQVCTAGQAVWEGSQRSSCSLLAGRLCFFSALACSPALPNQPNWCLADSPCPTAPHLLLPTRWAPPCASSTAAAAWPWTTTARSQTPMPPCLTRSSTMLTTVSLAGGWGMPARRRVREHALETAGHRLWSAGGAATVPPVANLLTALAMHPYPRHAAPPLAFTVVSAVQEVCIQRGIPAPTIITESGRALASHASVLVFDVLNT